MSSAVLPSPRLPNVVLFGTGEYTTGYVAGAVSTSDKPMGVVALTFFDLRARGLVGDKITLCGRSGARSAGIKQHLLDTIGASYGLDVSCTVFPTDPSVNDPLAYLSVLESGEFQTGDLAVVTTPDDTHKEIALACIRRGIHVIIAKPVVQSLEHHWELTNAAEEYNRTHATMTDASTSAQPLVLVGEFHKRFDPFYSDAVTKIQSGSLGPLSYAHAYMSQPKSQLQTFRSWLVSDSAADAEQSAPRAAPSDISFYLNSHHIDLVNLGLSATSRPIWVQALSAKGHANALFNEESATTTTGADGKEQSAPKRRKVDIDDTITVTVQYEHRTPNAATSATASSSATSPVETVSYGVAVFTSSWIAPRSDVHSQQRFHYLGCVGEISVDQAHRGYQMANDANAKGCQSLNPLFMRYQPNQEGRFVGQQGYGYKSFEHFVELARGRPFTGLTTHAHLASHAALFTTAILEAARRSLDQDNKKIHIEYDQQRRPTRLR